ncbi:MAG: ChbG/HpnK family deacetylase, partial [Hyphomicrobiaceae bacterium]
MSGPSQAAHEVLLCADDYAISAGVSRGIAELAEARRISAASAIVTLPRWVDDGPALAAL